MLKISASRSLGSGSVFSRRFLHGTRVVNAGHSKWANIKHTKAKNDAERTKIYNKIANQISVAVKLGGSADPAMNIRLATAIELANKNNVTKKVIENAIKKGSGTNDGASAGAEPCTYEGIGPAGVAFVVEALTDNKNRTVGLIRSTFNKFNGNMTPTLYFFERKGYVVIEPKEDQPRDFDSVMDIVLEIDGVEDLEQDTPNSEDTTGESEPLSSQDENSSGNDASALFEVITEAQQTNKVAETLRNQGFHIREMGVEYVPREETAMSPVTDTELHAKLEKFINQLEEIDDVTQIYSNIKE
ncbi:post-initiation translation factor DPC29 [Kluyveromyces lactis]|uniref:KLLA0D04378p n=1 Tax=Kluyveromyces lactis (strain ATCC 8585 / CBS 2359 / DSM 70799 / NBRC 1267 / NRRL Y-1140 / WM37) TaxID=284590 RepID=Q6CS32_KLULA|nr:uncharacterized protein KLLA0_D04378g [Kluyveromyces lactis]CAH00353.1 KLLA0D04378p [Kluyveromyces lactis]|eukprot:XP_453257.1 uncharacterized protein KLLA0_D04378g [Kluyveromyces lactis]